MAIRPTRIVLPLLAVGAAAVVLAPSGGAAGDATVGPTHVKQLSATGTTERACAKSVLAGRAGVSFSRYTAPYDGWVTVRLAGPDSAGDWDLGVFRANGTRLRGSGAFSASEVVQLAVRKGAGLGVQACRRPGASRSVPLRITYAKVTASLKHHGEVAGRMSQVRIHIKQRSAVKTLADLGIDLGEDVTTQGITAILYNDKERDLLRQAGFSFTTMIADLEQHSAGERAKERAYQRKVGRFGSPLPSGRTEYRMLEDVQADLKKIIADYPKLARVAETGLKTFQGREIAALEIAANVNDANEGRPYFVVNGLHHAREWPAVETPIEFALLLVQGYGKDPRITKILDTTRVIVQPLTNADGFDHTRNSIVTEGLFVGAYRRKTCSFPLPSGAVPCEAQIGVDPNRNYPQDWGGPGASSLPPSDTYRGPNPSSETEVQAVRKLVSKYPGTTMLTIHNVAALVLRPPGLKAVGLAPDEPRLKVLGDKMAKSTGYTSQYGWQLYDTTGTTQDWMYGATGGFSYTIEIGPPGGDFHDAYQVSVVDQWEGVGKFKGKGLKALYLDAAEHAIDEVDNAKLTGRAPAGRTLRLVKEVQTASSPVCTVTVDFIVAAPGGDCAAPGAVIMTPDRFEISMVVPATGKFSWIVNPSTRPFALKAGKTEFYKLTCEDAGKVIETQDLAVKRGETLKLDMPCGGVLLDDVVPSLLNVVIGKVRATAKKVNKAKRLSVGITIAGGTLSAVTVELRKGSRVYAAAALDKLAASGKVKLRLARGKKVKKGNFTIVLRGTQESGAAFELIAPAKLKA